MCKCEMAFCHACHYVSRNAGHALLCRKGLILCKLGEAATILVRTLPRSDETLLETARALFASAPGPGSGVVCLRVTPPRGGRFLPYRCALVLPVPTGAGVGVDQCKQALLKCLHHMHTCSIAIRTDVSPFCVALPAGRELSVTLFVGATAEHVEAVYAPLPPPPPPTPWPRRCPSTARSTTHRCAPPSPALRPCT